MGGNAGVGLESGGERLGVPDLASIVGDEAFVGTEAKFFAQFDR